MAKKQTYHHGDLRQVLLSAALEILKTKGARSISLREVARQAGVSHTAPYRHFKDKAALLAAVAEEGFTEFGRYLETAVAQVNAAPIASLQSTGEAYVRYALDHPTHFRVMFSCFPTDEPVDSQLSAASNGTFQILVGHYHRWTICWIAKSGRPPLACTGSMVDGSWFGDAATRWHADRIRRYHR